MDAPQALEQAIQGRRSIRRYDRRAVDDGLVCELLELVRLAPSSLGAEPWRFVVIRSPQTLRRLAELKDAHCPAAKRDAYPAGFLAAAPVVIAVCVDRTEAHGRPLENGTIAAAYLLLAAHARGLGAVYLTAYQPEDPELAHEISATLRLPPHVEAIALVPLGWPAERPTRRERRPLAEVIHHEAFGKGPPR